MATGASALSAALPRAAIAAPTFIAWHDQDFASHKQKVDANAALGYRTSSVSIYGDLSDLRYAAVMVKRSVVIAEQQFIGYSAGDFQAAFEDMSKQGYGHGGQWQ